MLTPPPPKPPIKIVCARCKSERVLRDAWAGWDEDAQRWDLHNVFDHAFCENCDGDTRLLELPLAADDSREVPA
jgi:hypothetical protein